MIVIDDAASIRRALRTQLQILGFNVLVFQSAEELLASEFAAGDACLPLNIQSGERSLQIIRTIDCHWIQRLAATARYCTKVQ